MPLDAVTETERVLQVPLDFLHASPLNPRSSADETRLADLADSMRTSGLQQPIVVRPWQDEYQIVFGHRRTLAARSLGWKTIPAIIRHMDDQHVVLAQAVENLQREDLSPMDEARGYRQLLDELKLPVDDVVPLVGRSRTQIYARLKLLELGPEAAAAVHEGRLAAEIGQLLARQPRQMQASLLEDILEGDYQGESLSYREVKRMLAQHHVPLKKARFDRSDPLYHLQKVGGTLEGDIRCGVTCAGCPMRSGNQPDFDPAAEDAEICFDTDCFNAKERAHAERAKTALAAKGAKVMKDAWSAREKLRVGQLIDLDKKDPAIDKKRTLREVLGDQLDGAQIIDYDGVKVAMTPRALETALKKAGVATASSLAAKAEDKPKKAKGENEWERRSRLAKVFDEKVRAALVPAVLAQCPLPGDLADVAKAFAENVGDPVEALQLLGVKAEAGRIRFNVGAALDQLDGEQIAKFLVLVTALSGINCMYADEPDPATQGICARRGVDLAAIRAEVYGEPEQPKKKGKK